MVNTIMDPETRRRLAEVFGDPTNVAPAGTGAILTRASKLDMEFATRVIQGMEMDRVFRDLGVVVAREMADEMERRGLKPSDYKHLEGLAQMAARRVIKNVAKSEVFEASLREHLGLRGG
jgi:hypothetical protein